MTAVASTSRAIENGFAFSMLFAPIEIGPITDLDGTFNLFTCFPLRGPPCAPW